MRKSFTRAIARVAAVMILSPLAITMAVTTARPKPPSPSNPIRPILKVHFGDTTATTESPAPEDPRRCTI